MARFTPRWRMSFATMSMSADRVWNNDGDEPDALRRDAPLTPAPVRTLLTWVPTSIDDGRAIPTSHFFDGCDDQGSSRAGWTAAGAARNRTVGDGAGHAAGVPDRPDDWRR